MDSNRIRELLDQRDKLDDELRSLVTGNGSKERKAQTCSTCGEAGHSARTCPTKA